MNFQSTTGNGPIIKQLYFRQAMAYLMDQQGVINGPLRGYATPTVGPVGNQPVNQFLSPKGRQGDPFPFSIAKAKALLASNGWTVVPGGATTCTDPAKCGPGIAKGKTLSFNFVYATGLSWMASEMTELQSNAAQVGIRLNLKPKPFLQVLESNLANCVVGSSPVLGHGQLRRPHVLAGLPAYRRDLFKTGTASNPGGYSNPKNDAMIEKTLISPNLSYMYAWEDYLSMQLPMEWQPDPASQLTEVATNLKASCHNPRRCPSPRRTGTS